MREGRGRGRGGRGGEGRGRGEGGEGEREEREGRGEEQPNKHLCWDSFSCVDASSQGKGLKQYIQHLLSAPIYG